MRTRDAIAQLIPHQGRMCLWEEVIDWDDASIRLRTHGHRDPEHPLRRNGRLRSVHLCEYGAQAMAVHGGLLAQRAGTVAAPGLLVSLRDVRLRCARFDDLPGAIDVDAQRLHGDASSAQYRFELRHGDDLIALGRAAVLMLPDSPDVRLPD